MFGSENLDLGEYSNFWAKFPKTKFALQLAINGEAISHQFIMLLDPPKRENGKSWAKVGTIFKRGGGGFPCPNFLAPQNGTFS